MVTVQMFADSIWKGEDDAPDLEWPPTNITSKKEDSLSVVNTEMLMMINDINDML